MVEYQRRFKRIESAFNVAAARARPPCDNSSGSDHSPEDTADLSDLVASFIEREGQIVLLPVKNDLEEEMDSCSDNDSEDVREIKELLEGLYGGEERMKIMAATEVAEKFVGDNSSRKRQLMTFLRN